MHVPDRPTSFQGIHSPHLTTTATTLIELADLEQQHLSKPGTSVSCRRPDIAMDAIIAQPHEILSQILAFVHPIDLARLSRTCCFLHRTIIDDDFLWKEHYLQLYDEPLIAPASWQNAVKELIKFEKVLQSQNMKMKDGQLEFVANTAISLMHNTSTSHPTRNQRLLGRYFSMSETNRVNVSAFLSKSSLFSRAGLPTDVPADTCALRQLSARLHVCYGLEIEPLPKEIKGYVSMDNDDDSSATVPQEIHPFARSRVYDLRAYKPQNYWGPFMDDGSGRVDWEKAQCIMIVLAHGLRIFSERTNGEIGPFWDKPFFGLGTNSFISHSFEKTSEETDLFPGQDPYGVRGTWMRVVNFLDYHDLFAFNFQPPLIPPDRERPPITTKEAFRLILLKLKVTKIETPAEDDEQSDPQMPIVHFEGVSKSLHMRWDPNANSQIRGTVRTTRQGDIRWTTFSVFHGEERWRSEGIQIGNINSGRGILGNWFDRDFDVHGPAGPTAFWKISDEFAAAMSN